MNQFQALVLRLLLLIAHTCINTYLTTMKIRMYDDADYVYNTLIATYKSIEIEVYAFIQGMN